MAHPYMGPPPAFGSGEIVGRYALVPLRSLPWYYDQNKVSAVALFAIVTIVALGRIFG